MDQRWLVILLVSVVTAVGVVAALDMKARQDKQNWLDSSENNLKKLSELIEQINQRRYEGGRDKTPSSPNSETVEPEDGELIIPDTTTAPPPLEQPLIMMEHRITGWVLGQLAPPDKQQILDVVNAIARLQDIDIGEVYVIGLVDASLPVPDFGFDDIPPGCELPDTVQPDERTPTRLNKTIASIRACAGKQALLKEAEAYLTPIAIQKLDNALLQVRQSDRRNSAADRGILIRIMSNGASRWSK